MKTIPKLPDYIRNPIYIFYALGSFTIFIICSLLAARPTVGAFERSLFYIFFDLPEAIKSLFIAVAVLGSVLAIVITVLVLLVRRRKDIALRVLLASVLAYSIVYVLSDWLSRARPSELLSGVVPLIDVSGFGFPSGQSAVLFAVGLILAVYAPKAYRRWIVYTSMILGCAGIFLGINLPLDVVAGWAIGFFCYSLTLLAIGSPYKRIDANTLASKLTAGGMPDVTLRPASVDARGSVPFFGESAGRDIFVKVFSQDNNAADWLFKLVRRAQYRRLEDEVPSLTPKRAIEHEAYLTMLAKYTAKARVPEVLGIYKVGVNSYAMAIIKIHSTGLDKLSKNKITDEILDGIWRQILKLHKHNIIHKDLRAANVMVEDTTNLPWIIDFGFSECAVNPKSHYKDNVEFIASSATKVGAKRAVAAAKRALGGEGIAQALPYMQFAALSGATTTDIKLQKGLIEKLRIRMIAAADISETIQKAKINRISYPRKFSKTKLKK